MKFHVTAITVQIDGRVYEWAGCPRQGALLRSEERGVVQGDVRMIGDTLFYARWVSREGWLRCVDWYPVEGLDDPNLWRKLRDAIFIGGE